jgi:phosphoglycerate dehydrogenase-like enzyme
MRVLAVKRHGPPLYNVDPLVSQIYAPDRLHEMLPQCDYVVVSAPLTAETKGMIDADAFAVMKPNAVLINVGRGPVVDEQALLAALSTNIIKGAALDVFDKEPLPEGHPFYKLQNVLLSPHCADHTPDWLERAMQFFIDQFGRFAKGEPLMSVVDKHLGY